MLKAVEFLKERFPGQEIISTGQLCAALGISRTTFWRMRKDTNVAGREGNGGGILFQEAVGLINHWLSLKDPAHKAFFKNLPPELADEKRPQAPGRKIRGHTFGPRLIL